MVRLKDTQFQIHLNKICIHYIFGVFLMFELFLFNMYLDSDHKKKNNKIEKCEYLKRGINKRAPFQKHTSIHFFVEDQ